MYKDLKNAALDIIDCITMLERLQAENKELREYKREMDEWQREQLAHNEYMSVSRLYALLGRTIPEKNDCNNNNLSV